MVLAVLPEKYTSFRYLLLKDQVLFSIDLIYFLLSLLKIICWFFGVFVCGYKDVIFMRNVLFSNHF